MESEETADPDFARIPDYEWTKENTHDLIEMVKNNPIIWDVNCGEYRNKKWRKKAYKRISENLTVPEGEVIRKWHNLKTQYYQVLKKKNMKNGSGYSGGVKWVYFSALNFLPQTIDCRETMSNDSGNNTEARPDVKNEGQNVTVHSIEFKKKKIENKDGGKEAALAKAISILNQAKDAEQIFGDYVAAELRALKTQAYKNKLKRIIQRAIIDISEKDDECSTSSYEDQVGVRLSRSSSPVVIEYDELA